MRVSVFGLGYVGCVSSAGLAQAGHEVIGVDVSREKVDMINAAAPPVVEPGLGELLVEVVGRGRLRATTSTEEAVRDSDIGLICVGTPSRASGQLDASAVDRVGWQIGQALRFRPTPYAVTLRSTVVPERRKDCCCPPSREGRGEGRSRRRASP